MKSKRLNNLLAKVLLTATFAAVCTSCSPPPPPAPSSAAPFLAGWHNTMLNVAAYIDNSEAKVQFETDVNTFQTRAQAAGIDGSDIIFVYSKIYSMFDDNPRTTLGRAERIQIARELMHQIADPTDINQGQHNVCSASVLEKIIDTRSPLATVSMVCSLAQTGRWTAADRTTVRLDGYSKQMDWEAARFQIRKTDRNSDRSRASQLTHWALANLYLLENGDPRQYVQLPTPESYGDTGSRLLDPRTGRMDKVNPNDFRLSLMNADKMYFLVTGKHATKFSIVGAKVGAPGAYSPKNPADLLKALAEIKAAGMFPAAVEVQSKNPPFASDEPFAENGWHEVTITDFDPATGMVMIDNQWGRINDHLGRTDGKEPIYYVVLFNAINDAAHAQPQPIPMPVPLTHKIKRTIVTIKKGK